MSDHTRLTAFVHGHVQGVGFRWWVRSQALELGLAGTATNLVDGRVSVVVEGPRDTCQQMLNRLQESASSHRRPGYVDSVIEQWSDPKGLSGFTER